MRLFEIWRREKKKTPYSRFFGGFYSMRNVWMDTRHKQYAPHSGATQSYDALSLSLLFLVFFLKKEKKMIQRWTKYIYITIYIYVSSCSSGGNGRRSVFPSCFPQLSSCAFFDILLASKWMDYVKPDRAPRLAPICRYKAYSFCTVLYA